MKETGEGTNFSAMEKKWQAAWMAAGVNKATRQNGKKFFMLFAYPGISGYLHVGHFRGFSYTDMITRYKRMQGFDIFFPVGTHASGNPSITFAAKVRAGEKDEYLISNGCPPEKIKELGDPLKVVEFFNQVYINDWKKLGYLADWDTFACTTDNGYQKFIGWQFRQLKEKGLLIQKPYFSPVCPEHGPVSIDTAETDISKGGNAEKNEYTLLKFKIGNDFLVAATLRPETIFGQTNLWVNPSIGYVRIQVNDENWIVSREAAEKLQYQIDGVRLQGPIEIDDFIGKKVKACGIDREIPILPASFCKSDVGTGIVTSVPSDAPYDYIALQELKANKDVQTQYHLDLKGINPIAIITSAKFGDMAAKTICEKEGITTLNDPKLETVTKEIYSAGFHVGVMNEKCESYAGMKVSEAKDKIRTQLLEEKKAGIMHDLSETVICRCGKTVFIKRLDDQWFIKYSDPELTEKSKNHAQNMNIYPQDYKNNLPAILDWFGDRPATRIGNWLGTRLPFDEKWIIEPIADSTIYPAFYIVARHVNTGKIKTEELNDAFFDYVFLGKGNPQSNLWKTIREEFEYFYPIDLNLGGKEHQTVHFPVFVMNHVGIMNQRDWPLGIFVNYWVTGKAGKISKSKGGAEPIPDAIRKYSVDAMRFYYANIGSPHKDVVWDEEELLRFRSQLEKVHDIFRENAENNKESALLDAWLAGTLAKSIEKAYTAMENYDLRAYSESVFSEINNAFKWYLRRGGSNPKPFLKDWAKLMSPITPHLAEECWELLGEKNLICIQDLPEKGTINQELEQQEQNVQKIIEDVAQIKKIINIDQPKKVKLFMIPKDQFIRDAGPFFEKEFGCPVEVIDVNKTEDPKAKKAKLGKPGISIE